MTTLLDKFVASKYFGLTVTIALFLIMYAAGFFTYRGFSKPQVFLNLFIDNAALIIVAIGVTFTLLIGGGGIDISVGSMVCLTSMVVAWMLQNTGVSVPVVLVLALGMGAAFGCIQGTLIAYFDMQPFIVTLAGNFFARGMAAVISQQTINIDNPAYVAIAQTRIHLGGRPFITAGVVVALAALLVASLVLKYTRFGRRVYAVGGSEQSAALMGLDTRRTKLSVYVISGFCGALGGVVYSWTMLSGYTLHAAGMELDAIASAVIGGTLLTGGVGFVPGTLFGALIQGVIQTFISFQGTLSAWWTKIVIGALLCLFILMQTLLTRHRNRMARASSHAQTCPPAKTEGAVCTSREE